MSSHKCIHTQKDSVQYTLFTVHTSFFSGYKKTFIKIYFPLVVEVNIAAVNSVGFELIKKDCLHTNIHKKQRNM